MYYVKKLRPKWHTMRHLLHIKTKNHVSYKVVISTLSKQKQKFYKKLMAEHYALPCVEIRTFTMERTFNKKRIYQNLK